MGPKKSKKYFCPLWCGIAAKRSLYFFQNDEEIIVKVDGHQYQTSIENLLRPVAEKNPDL